MATIYILLGSNIEPRIQYINNATRLIKNRIGSVETCSGIYESAALGFESDQPFYNQVLKVKSNLTVEDSLRESLIIENELGRVRDKNILKSRTIDIDILYYDDIIVNNDNLIVPHPRLHNRRFTLEPLCEIAPNYYHPVLEKRNFELLKNCSDTSKVTLKNKANEEL